MAALRRGDITRNGRLRGLSVGIDQSLLFLDNRRHRGFALVTGRRSTDGSPPSVARRGLVRNTGPSAVDQIIVPSVESWPVQASTAIRQWVHRGLVRSSGRVTARMVVW